MVEVPDVELLINLTNFELMYEMVKKNVGEDL